jgi:hypothetical protein
LYIVKPLKKLVIARSTGDEAIWGVMGGQAFDVELAFP